MNRPKNSRAPEGWDAELWFGIAPEIRDKVRARLREQEDMFRSRSEAAEQSCRQMNEGMAQMLASMQAAHRGALSRVDWKELSRRDPQAFARLSEALRKNGAGMDELRKRGSALHAQLSRREAERTARRVSAEMQEAFEAVLPRIAELIGEGFERKAFKEEMAQYLLQAGVPPEALLAMSKGYELELCTKAMLFDKMKKRRAEAEAKLAEVPEVSSPRRSGLEEGSRLGRARAELNKNPNSTEALAALFAAM